VIRWIYRRTYLANKRERARWKLFKPNAVVRDLNYRRWIQTLPCCVCFPHLLERLRLGMFSLSLKSEAAHSGPHGISIKASDLTCIPLCANHHRIAKDSYHELGPSFFEHHGLDRLVLVKGLNEAYNPFWREAA